jgi:hypothetical protein
VSKAKYESQEEILEHVRNHPESTRQNIFATYCNETEKSEREKHKKAITSKLRSLLDKKFIVQRDSRLSLNLQDMAQPTRSRENSRARSSPGNAIESYSDLYSANPDDSFFYHIPFLISVGEVFCENDLAERANGFLGYYLKQGLSGDAASDHFLAKIRQHLKNPMLSSFIQKEGGFKWKVICSENNLILWRLYSMLHTVLFKSEKSKIGFAVEFYEPLIELLKEKFNELDSKLETFHEKEKYLVWLLLNGVQLETLMPKIQLTESDEEDLRSRLRKVGIPLITHNEGKDNETTLIEA